MSLQQGGVRARKPAPPVCLMLSGCRSAKLSEWVNKYQKVTEWTQSSTTGFKLIGHIKGEFWATCLYIWMCKWFTLKGFGLSRSHLSKFCPIKVLFLNHITGWDCYFRRLTTLKKESCHTAVIVSDKIFSHISTYIRFKNTRILLLIQEFNLVDDVFSIALYSIHRSYFYT